MNYDSVQNKKIQHVVVYVVSNYSYCTVPYTGVN
jgi:hypothetical protein